MKGIKYGRLFGYVLTAMFFLSCNQVAEEGVSLSLAASPDSGVRNALFASFLESAQNRRPESRVLSALALLCHRDRQEESLANIVPSLDALEEI